MFILVVNQENDHSSHPFSKKSVTIGSSPSADIYRESLNPEHIKIFEEENGQFYIQNLTNDPLTTLNGKPFGKRSLSHGDIIKIQDLEMTFEEKTKEIEDKNFHSITSDEELIEALEKKILSSKNRTIKLPPIKQSADDAWWIETDLSQSEIQSLLQEVESLASDEWEKKGESLKNTDNNETDKISVLKEEHLSSDNSSNEEFDSPQESLQNPSSVPFSISPFRKKWLWGIAGILVLLLVVLFTFIYLKANQKHDEEEIKAARGVADIAMSLIYARTHEIKPPNQNWSNPDFLKENLSHLLSPNYSPSQELDIQGKFQDSSYILRIYTNQNSSQFILIAHPSPSLLNWLFPKTTILLDSKDMILRKTTNLRSINRLLMNPNTLEESNAQEISKVLSEEEIIPLATLGSDHKHREFIPPRELSWIKPGADNIVYNAPRYFKLTEPILQKASLISKDNHPQALVKELKEHIERISSLKDPVLYSSQGIQESLLAQKGLKLVLGDQFLVGYLILNPKNHLIIGSHLLVIGTHAENNLPKKEGFITIGSSHAQSALAEVLEDINDVNVNGSLSNQLLEEHPLKEELIALKMSQIEALKPLKNALVGSLEEGNLEQQKDRFEMITKQYETLLQNQKEKISESLPRIYQKYHLDPDQNVTLAEMISFLWDVGLESYIQGSLITRLQEEEKEIKMQKTNPRYFLQRIENTKDLYDLEEEVQKSVNALSQLNHLEPEEKLHYQKELQKAIIAKVGNLLITTNRESLKDEDREIVNRILAKTQRIITAD